MRLAGSNHFQFFHRWGFGSAPSMEELRMAELGMENGQE
jgi:hypothetical protein